MRLSVVTTMYCSAGYLVEFHDRLTNAIFKLGFDYEIIFVDDGSPDNSLEIALDLQRKDKNIKVIELSRNFGQHKAVLAGLMECSGEIVFLIDCDLEEKPEWLAEFHSKLVESNVDVVFGVQEKRKGRIGERVFGFLFYRVFNYLAYQRIPENAMLVRLMKSEYVNELTKFETSEFFLASSFVAAGFVQLPIRVVKGDKGTSAYNFSKKLQMTVNAIVSSTDKPLVFIFYLGILMSSLAAGGMAYVVIYHLFVEQMQIGWPSLILSIWFLSGLIILSLGVIGIYLSKVFLETRKQPLYIIRKRYF